MLKYIIKRILWIIPVMLFVIILVYTVLYFTPGDPAMAVLGSNYTQEAYDAKVAEMGLDKPYIVQLANYIWKIVTRFDFGTSYINNRSVGVQLMERIKPTLIIGVLGVIISQLIAIPVGVVAATHHQKPGDYIISSLCIAFAAVPGFLLALLLMVFFCGKLHWFAASGITSWKSYVLPIICSVMSPLVSSCRMTRSSMLEVIRQDYIRTARAKGVPKHVVTMKHALKNALIPVLTMMGMHLGAAMGGSMIVETIFTIPGIGVLMKTSINNQDYPLVEGCVILIAFVMSILMLLTDLAYAAVDPRVYDSITGGKKKSSRKNKKSVEVSA